MIATHLEKLGLYEPPSPEELERHFHALIKRYHPDRNPGKQDWANQKSREIIAAYSALKKSLHKNTAHTYDFFQFESRLSARKSKGMDRQGQKRKQWLSFQILRERRGKINCLIPLKAVYQINHIQELFDKTAQLPKELLFLSNDGQSEQIDLSEIQNAHPKQSLFWLYPEAQKKALLIDAAWQMAEMLRIDICNTPILPHPKSQGIRIYHKHETFYCPAELVFQMNFTNFSPTQKATKIQV